MNPEPILTEVIVVDPLAPDAAAIARGAECLRRGGLVAFPTETVYGLGVHALDRDAVKRLFAAKGRPANDPLIVHVASLDQAARLVAAIPVQAFALAERFWPGPLTLVMGRAAVVPDEVTAGLDTVAVRVPAHLVALALLTRAGIPVAAPSANLFSRPSPTSATHVLHDLRNRIDMVIDGGPTHVGVESTVLDLSRAVPMVLRPGAVTIEMLQEVLPRVEIREGDIAEDEAAPSPGLLSRHYSPRTPLTLYRGPSDRTTAALAAAAQALLDQKIGVAIIALDEEAPALATQMPQAHVITIGAAHDLPTISRRLYAALREADASGAGAIFMRDLADAPGLTEAVRDRLQRAAARIVPV